MDREFYAIIVSILLPFRGLSKRLLACPMTAFAFLAVNFKRQ